MASAEIVRETIVREEIVLTMTFEEAEIVRSLCGHVNLLRGDVGEGVSDVYNALTASLSTGYSQYRVKGVEAGTIVLVKV